MYIERALEPVVRRYSEHFKVVVVTGPRQVGKTTMLKHLAEQDERRGVERSYVTLDNTPRKKTPSCSSSAIARLRSSMRFRKRPSCCPTSRWPWTSRMRPAATG